MVQPFWKVVWGFLIKLTYSYRTTQELYSWEFIPETCKFMSTQDLDTMSLSALLAIPNNGKQPKCPSFNRLLGKHTVAFNC